MIILFVTFGFIIFLLILFGLSKLDDHYNEKFKIGLFNKASNIRYSISYLFIGIGILTYFESLSKHFSFLYWIIPIFLGMYGLLISIFFSYYTTNLIYGTISVFLNIILMPLVLIGCAIQFFGYCLKHIPGFFD